MVFFEEGVNLALQDLLAPSMDVFFKLVSDAGDTILYGVITAFLYWCYDKRFAIRLAFALLLSSLVNRMLKHGFMSDRPDELIWRPGVEETGYGFPSGHSQNTATFWGYVSWERPQGIVLLLATVIVVLVSLSRLYLGVHYLGDVIGGVAFGILILIAFRVIEPRLIPRLAGLKEGYKYLLAVVPAAAAFLAHLAVHPSSAIEYSRLYAPAIAFSTGYMLEGRYVGLGPAGTKRLVVQRMALGLVLLGAAYGLFVPLDPHPVLEFMRFLLAGYVLTLGAPWLFTKVEASRSMGEAAA